MLPTVASASHGVLSKTERKISDYILLHGASPMAPANWLEKIGAIQSGVVLFAKKMGF